MPDDNNQQLELNFQEPTGNPPSSVNLTKSFAKKSRIIIKSAPQINLGDGYEVIAVNTNDPFDVLKLLNRINEGGLEKLAISYDGQEPVPVLNALTDLNVRASVEEIAGKMIQENAYDSGGKIKFSAPHIFITPRQLVNSFGEKPKLARFEDIPFSLNIENCSLALRTKTKVPLVSKENKMRQAILVKQAVLVIPDLDQPNRFVLRVKPLHDFVSQMPLPVVRVDSLHARTYNKYK